MAALHPCLVVAACALAWSGGVSAYYDQLPPSLQQLPSSLQQLPASLQQLPGVPAPDPETASYLIPRLAHKYRPPTGDWLDVADPRLYLLTENDNDEPQVQSEVESGPRRLKRTGLGGTPSLSIVNPLEVLRQRLLLEIARRRMRQSEEKIHANREWLLSIGKRSVDAQQQDNVHDKLAEAEEDRSGQDAVSRWASAS